ncbi:hypothetical protein FA95DRAFT_1491755, partial [Auriscalpium vulgare]
MLRTAPNLQGFTIPGRGDDRLIVNLFADDTLLYLKKSDRHRDVQSILDAWCAASGAKFNIDKTEYLPIGSRKHRRHVARRRTLNRHDTTPIKESTRIALDGESIRSLGVYLGNGNDDAAPWEPVLDKIQKQLTRWSSSHPSLHAKRLIIQMIVGGSTQYLAKVQGMPKAIEGAITKQIRDFVWGHPSPHPPIATTQLYLPVSQGGL